MLVKNELTFSSAEKRKVSHILNVIFPPRKETDPFPLWGIEAWMRPSKQT